jgi:hypothetical protein
MPVREFQLTVDAAGKVFLAGVVRGKTARSSG